MAYTVGEMAKRLGVPASTLRYYDKEGLLPQVERSPGGIRVFQAADDRLHEKGGNVHSGHPALHPVVRPGGRHHRRPAGDVPEPAGGAAPPDRGDATHPGNRGVQMLVL